MIRLRENAPRPCITRSFDRSLSRGARAHRAIGAGHRRLGISRSSGHPGTSSRPPRDAIVRLNESIAKGEVTLAFDALPRGYLASVLKALDISPSSQTLVFSENSLQRAHISKATPRAIYFNDTVAVAWAKGADTIEATALDADTGRSLLLDTADARSEAAVHSPQCRLPAVPPAASDPRRARAC